MNIPDVFGEVRSLLHGPQTLKNWQSLWAHVDTIPQDIYEQEFQAYVHAQCALWPEDMRAFKLDSSTPSRQVEVAVTLKKGTLSDLVAIDTLGRIPAMKRVDLDVHRLRGLNSVKEWRSTFGVHQWDALKALSIKSDEWSLAHQSMLEDPTSWPSLKHLSFKFMNVAESLFESWAQCDHLMNLESLELERIRSLKRSFGRLLASAAPQWTSLAINACSIPQSELTQLAASPLSRVLRSLELRRALKHQETVDHLSVLPWGALERLVVSENDAHLMGPWLHPEQLPALRTLVARNVFGQGLLFRDEQLLRQLEHLDLSHSPGSVCTLVDMKFTQRPWPELRTLRLSGSLDGPRAIALLKSLNAPNLHTLDLSRIPLSNRAVSSLADNPSMRHLRVLDLSNCNVSSSHVLDLCDSTSIRGLHRLELSGNPIDAITKSALQRADLLSPEAKLSLAR